MKKLALAITLAAALAPVSVLADTQTNASLPAGQYLIVDAQSNRTIGTLVALGGAESGLATIGSTVAQPEKFAGTTQPIFPHITAIGGPSDDLLTGYHAQFGDTSP